YGYDWKIPQTVVDWRGKADNPEGSEQIVRVYTLVEKDNWLCMQKRRTIERFGDKYVDANWDSFDPPARIVPVYNPVRHLYLSSEADPQWMSVSTVTREHYERQVGSNGKATIMFERLTGKAHLGLSVKVLDWQKTAIAAWEVAGYRHLSESKPVPPPASLQQTNPQAYQAQMHVYQVRLHAYQAALQAYQQEAAFIKKRRDAWRTLYKYVYGASV